MDASSTRPPGATRCFPAAHTAGCTSRTHEAVWRQRKEWAYHSKQSRHTHEVTGFPWGLTTLLAHPWGLRLASESVVCLGPATALLAAVGLAPLVVLPSIVGALWLGPCGPRGGSAIRARTRPDPDWRDVAVEAVPLGFPRLLPCIAGDDLKGFHGLVGSPKK